MQNLASATEIAWMNFAAQLAARSIQPTTMQEELLALLAGRTGHFCMESGYHSEQWFELSRVLAQTERLRPAIRELGRRLQTHGIDAVCGPVTGGAKLAELIGGDLALPYFAAARVETGQPGLFPVQYRVSASDRDKLCGKRVALVDDAISAGSAVRGAFADLLSGAARPVVIGALYIFGDHAARFAAEQGIALEGVARTAFRIWKPDECPQCRAGVPVEIVSDAQA
jgi:orotate phosphoribosyltransferase